MSAVVEILNLSNGLVLQASQIQKLPSFSSMPQIDAISHENVLL